MDNSARQLQARVAILESTVDMLESELGYLNTMLTRCGFSEGIKTLKETVEELLLEDDAYSNNEKSESA